MPEEHETAGELALLRASVDRILRGARPTWARGDKGLIRSLTFALREANSAHERSSTQADAQRMAACEVALSVEQGKPISVGYLDT